MDKKIHDLMIIGSGPAGLTASIYAARAELDTIVVEKAPMSGGQIINTYEVDNYPGLPGINGFDLGMKFREHSDHLGAVHVIGEVKEFGVKNNIKKVVLENGDEHYARTAILATGAAYRKLDVKGEAEFSGMGVSYCATCDGAFFRNRTVAVVGGGDVAVEDAIFLARICKKVYVIHRRDEFRAAKTLSTKLNEYENVTILWNHVVDEIKGNEKVEGLLIRDIKENKQSEIEVDGVFIAVGTIPNSQLFVDTVATDKQGYIIADEMCETNVPGIYAAGDIRTKGLRQVITAASDGANAITSVERYLYSVSE